MKLINFIKGEAGRELLDICSEKDWEYDDLLWAINLAVCSKSFEDREDITQLSLLLIELNPYLVASKAPLSKAYNEDAIAFLSKASGIPEDKLEMYSNKLKELLKSRAGWVKEIKPQVYNHLISN